MAASNGRELTPKQQRFVQEYLIDLNATQAAVRAGYSERTANVCGFKLLVNASIASAIAERQALLEQETGITQKWVLDKLRENAERALQAIPVYDKEGKPTGEYTYNGAVANGALQLIGKHLGMFVDRHDITSNGEGLARFVPDLGPGLLS